MPVRPGLIEHGLQDVRQQRHRDGYEQSVVAGPPQRLATPTRGKPADGGQHQKDLLVGAPGQGAGEFLRSRLGVAGDRTSDRDIRRGRPDVDRQGILAVGECDRPEFWLLYASCEGPETSVSFQRTSCRPGSPFCHNLQWPFSGFLSARLVRFPRERDAHRRDATHLAADGPSDRPLQLLPGVEWPRRRCPVIERPLGRSDSRWRKPFGSPG